jgi:uncharacterized RDD family membrane protein YckC
MATTSRRGSLDDQHQPPPWRARLRASVYDLVPIWSCLAGTGALSGLLRLAPIDVFGRLFACRATADATNFALTVLPAGMLFSASEAGRSSASWGKQRVGLAVIDLAGNTPTLGRAVGRNAVKFAAWQCAHLGLLRVTGVVSHRHSYALGSGLLWGAYLVSAADIVPALRRSDARALHDLATGTRVVTHLRTVR